MAVLASAPGKLILMGEHAAVYGRPALVAAIGRRARVRLEGSASGDVELDLPDVGLRERVPWNEVERCRGELRERWLEYSRDPARASFAALAGRDPARLVKVALGETAALLGEGPRPGVALRVTSELPVGSGFGSSAAVGTAVVAAYLAFRGRRPDAATVDRLALEVERRQHGLPSGIDHSTVVRGGVVWAWRAEDGRLAVEPLALRPGALDSFEVFQTGVPVESTGAVVAAVRRRREDDPARFDALLDRMESAALALRRWLTDPAAPPEDGAVGPVRAVEECLEALGVVPEGVRAAVRAVERGGGGAKISGAGALTGHAAGCLLRVRGGAGWDGEPRALAGYERLEVELGAEGLQVEEVA